MRLKQLQTISLKPEVEFTLDLRIKLVFVATVCTIMISGKVGGIMTVIHPMLALVPFALLLLSDREKAAVSYIIAYAAAYSMISFVMPAISGIVSILIGKNKYEKIGLERITLDKNEM